MEKMDKNMKYALAGISVALAIITAVYTMGITKRRAQMLLIQGYEVMEISFPFQNRYQCLVRDLNWIGFQSALLVEFTGSPLVCFNGYQMYFLTAERNWVQEPQSLEPGYYATQWVYYYTDILPWPYMGN